MDSINYYRLSKTIKANCQCLPLYKNYSRAQYMFRAVALNLDPLEASDPLQVSPVSYPAYQIFTL